MSDLKGTNVVAPVLPFTTLDTYPTHFALYGKGGFRSVKTMDDLDNIPEQRREEGMIVYVIDDPQGINTYQLIKGEWTKSKIGAGIESIATWKDLEEATKTRVQPGDVFYVKELDQFFAYSSSKEWHEFSRIYVGGTEPNDKSVLWVDTKGGIVLTEKEVNDLNVLQKTVALLQEQVFNLEKLMTLGVIPGDIADSYRRELMAIAEPLKPEGMEGDDVEEDTNEPKKPEVDRAQYTTTCVCAKCGTAKDFSENRQDLIDGELLFYTDRQRFAIYANGKFYVTATSDSGVSGGGGSGISIDDLYALNLNYLNFTDGESNYRVRVNDSGKIVVGGYNNNVTLIGDRDSTWGVYVNYLLGINSVYCGGVRTDESLGEDCMVSHNFVELANGSKKDVNLNGIHLLYTDLTADGPYGFAWKVLDLEGVIKAGSTFLIRGAKCNPANTALINIDDYDMEWLDENGDPIKFKQGKATFYLVAGRDYEGNIADKTLSNPWLTTNNGGPRSGYIDSCGFGDGAAVEGSSAYIVDSDWNNALFVRRFPLDPSKQANKAYGSRSTPDLWFTIDLSKHDERMGNSIQYYWQDFRKVLMSPRTSWSGKNFFSNKTDFIPEHPNIINITFGIQATDGGVGKRASRCFNWVSIGYYDEFLEYRTKGATTWTKVYSITPNNRANTEAINKFMDFYQRYRWKSASGKMMTTHKCIVNNLAAGEYEYRVGRDDDENYYSPIMTFKVVTSESVTSFSYIQVTDQQGFNWAEYTAWKKTAYMINETEKNYNFTVNTGDATQSGNRPNEWLDYWEARRYLRDKEEMFTIGNNDLCGHVSTELTDGEDATSKYSHINILRYYTFELDPNNDNYFATWQGLTIPIYSIYSYNYGNWHFVSLNSEYAQASSKMYKDWVDPTYKGDSTFASTVNAKIEDWLKKDLQIWKGITGNTEPTNCSKVVVYMHEMPFTIVTDAFMSGSAARVGSHLNTLDSNGLYRFSRLFKKYGIRLVMGGHKHTYCLTKPIYDAPEGYVSSTGAVNSSVDLMAKLGTNDTQATALSRKPVIQVTKSSDIDPNNNYARYELVSKISAPTYVMSQASGYKLVSNKEMPACNEYQIPWLLAYFKQAGTPTTTKENVAQHYPMYIRYDVTDANVVITVKQVHGIWDVNIDRNTSTWNMNRQTVNLSCVPMTLSTTSNSDKQAYGITTVDSFTITL